MFPKPARDVHIYPLFAQCDPNVENIPPELKNIVKFNEIYVKKQRKGFLSSNILILCDLNVLNNL